MSNWENTASGDVSKPKPWTGVAGKGGMMTCREERPCENDQTKLARNADGVEEGAQVMWPRGLGRWTWNVQGASCWKGHAFTDFFNEDEDGYPIGRHLLSFLSYLVGDSQAIHLTVQWAKWFSLAIKAWNSREPQSREREGSRGFCMFSGDFGNNSCISHVLICSSKGCSVHANCYNKSNGLHMYDSLFFTFHLSEPRINISPYYWGTLGKLLDFSIP